MRLMPVRKAKTIVRADFYGLDDVASIFGISRSTVRNMMRDRDLASLELREES